VLPLNFQVFLRPEYAARSSKSLVANLTTNYYHKFSTRHL